MSLAHPRLSLRLRITTGALLVVAGALVGAGLLVIGVVEREMTGQIDSALRADADFTSRLITSGSGLPMSEGPTDLYVQFVGADGQVLGAGTAAAGRPALGAPSTGATAITSISDAQLGDLRVLTTPAPNNARLTLVLARSSANVAAVHATLVRLLTGLVVVGSALLAVLVWIVVGRSLRPVEDMRRTVDEMGESDLRNRLEPPRTGDEIERLAETLNVLLDRLDRSVAREHQFVADASHELRTPIAGMRALLETEAADPSLVVLTRADALARLDRLNELVEQLLVLERADADGVAPPDRPVDLDELVLGEARQLSHTTTLLVDTSHVSGGQVAGRDTDLARVVENLATNAARYARTTISFSVRQRDGDVELAVTDDGPGIDVADRARVFERFATLDDARGPDRSGAGLGLSIVAAIVATQHGTVHVEDGDGAGARFVVHLPAFVPPRRRATPADHVDPGDLKVRSGGAPMG